MRYLAEAHGSGCRSGEKVDIIYRDGPFVSQFTFHPGYG